MADRWRGANEPTPSGGTREANPTIKSLGTERWVGCVHDLRYKHLPAGIVPAHSLRLLPNE